MVKQCYQTGHFNNSKIGEKCQKSKIQMPHFQQFSNNVSKFDDNDIDIRIQKFYFSGTIGAIFTQPFFNRKHFLHYEASLMSLLFAPLQINKTDALWCTDDNFHAMLNKRCSFLRQHQLSFSAQNTSFFNEKRF